MLAVLWLTNKSLLHSNSGWGCGSGRGLLWLKERGYHTLAFVEGLIPFSLHNINFVSASGLVVQFFIQ